MTETMFGIPTVTVGYPWANDRLHFLNEGRDWEGDEWLTYREDAHDWAKENGWCVRTTWYRLSNNKRRFVVAFTQQRLDVNNDGTRNKRNPETQSTISRRNI